MLVTIEKWNMSIALQLVWRFSYTRWIRHLIYAVRLVLYNTVSVVKICYLVTKSCTTLLWPPCTVLIRLLCPRNSPDKNTGVSCHFLLQGIFPTQESNLGFLLCRQILYQLSHQGIPHGMLELQTCFIIKLQMKFRCK